MAVNDFRSMSTEFSMGIVDNTYIHIAPDRAAVENPPIERLSWPQYANAERHIDHPFVEAHLNQAHLPRERKNWGYGTDSAY